MSVPGHTPCRSGSPQGVFGGVHAFEVRLAWVLGGFGPALVCAEIRPGAATTMAIAASHAMRFIRSTYFRQFPPGHLLFSSHTNSNNPVWAHSGCNFIS